MVNINCMVNFESLYEFRGRAARFLSRIPAHLISDFLENIYSIVSFRTVDHEMEKFKKQHCLKTKQAK